MSTPSQPARPQPAAAGPAGAGPVGLPRGLVIAEAWRGLDGVGPLSNASGLPLARTVKLLLDPLVLRPAAHPHLGAAIVTIEAAAELRRRIADAGPVLAATAAWFGRVKRARRAAGITDGHPQDLYFQRCFELAHTRGRPGADAADLARAVVDEVHGERRLTPAGLRAYLADPQVHERVCRSIGRAWARRPGPAGRGDEPGLRRLLDGCAVAPEAVSFNTLVGRGAGSAAAAAVETPGAALALGLSAREVIGPPEVGRAASTATMPPPFDRSILERLFAPVRALDAVDAAALVDAEVTRSAAPWQLADEANRVLLAAAELAGRDLASDSPAGTDAGARLRARWRREAFVRRALRLPEASPRPSDGAREALLRRLWVRAHGRELRAETVPGETVWDLLDGALRSVILDRRDRVKADLARASARPAAERASA